MGFFSNDKDDSERVEDGQIKVRIIIELLGQPKDLMVKTFDTMLAKLKEECKVVKEDRADFKPEGKLWSTFAELELWVKDFQKLTSIMFHYMPSSIEILEPQQFVLRAHDFSDYLNDMQGRLHETDMKLKNSRAEVEVLKKNAGGLLFNLMHFSLRDSPKTVDELAKSIGTTSDDIKFYVEAWEKQGKFIKEGDKYRVK